MAYFLYQIGVETGLVAAQGAKSGEHNLQSHDLVPRSRPFPTNHGFFYLVMSMQDNQSAIMEALVEISNLRGDSEPSASIAMEMERIAQLAVMAISCKDKPDHQKNVMYRIARFLSGGKKPISLIRRRVMSKKISAYDVDIGLKAMIDNGSVVEVDVNNSSNGRTTKNYTLA